MRQPRTLRPAAAITLMVLLFCVGSPTSAAVAAQAATQPAPEEARRPPIADPSDRAAIREKAIERARMLVREMIARTDVPGMSAAVGVDGEVVWAEGFGLADLELRVPATDETRFRIGSVSKPLTAAAIGLLVDRGLLDLDAPVQRYVPGFPEKPWPITTRQLAGHLAGIRHYDGDEFLSSRRYETVTEGLAIFQDSDLLFEPGTGYSYSSYGWNLISAVIEGASGEEFLPFMQREVFAALGMHDTTADWTDRIIPNRTRFYERTPDRGAINAPYVDNSYKWAGGGFIATTADLVRFGMAHIDAWRGEGFLSAETLEEMWTSQNTRDGEETGYGIGWSVEVDRDGRRVASHGGGSVGGTTFLQVFPDDGVVVAIVANSRGPTGPNETWTLAEPFLDPTGALVMQQRLSIVRESDPDLSGGWACTTTDRPDDPSEFTIWLLGGPGSYWGSLMAGNDRAPILYTVTDGNAIRTISMAPGGSLSNQWLLVEGDRAVGSGMNRPLECVRE